MAKVITITNQKGGVGKTSMTQMLAICLKAREKRVLCVDFDPQGNLSFSAEADTDEIPTIYEVLRGSAKIQQAIQQTKLFDVLGSNILLTGLEMEFTRKDREFILRNALEPIKGQYDVILIDTPPGLGFLTINAFAASDSILIPALADIFSLKGVAELHDTIMHVKKRCNPKLVIEGIVLTRYNPRSELAKSIKETAERVAKALGTYLFKKKIRVSGAVSEAQALQQNLFEYAPKSLAAQDFRILTRELLERWGEDGN